MMKSNIKALFVALLALSLASCSSGGGGGGGGGGGDNGGGGGGDINIGEKITVTGTITDLIVALKASNNSDGQRYAASDWEGATVQLIDSEGNVLGTATVGSGGSYTLSDIPKGNNYVVRARQGNVVMKAFIEDATTNQTDVKVDPTSSAEVKIIGSVVGNDNIGEEGVDVSDAIAQMDTEAIIAAILDNPTLLAAIAEAIAANIVADSNYTASETDVATVGVVSTDVDTEVETQIETLTTTVTTTVAADYPSVSAEIAAAKTALELQDVKTANTKYNEAYGLNPFDKSAAFGAAITDIIMLIEDTDVQALITKWEEVAPTVAELLATDDKFEVYGGNSEYCGDDPANNGYTKITTTDTSSPFTFSGTYMYYIVHVPFGSKVTSTGGTIDGSAGFVNCINGDYDWNSDGTLLEVTGEYSKGTFVLVSSGTSGDFVVGIKSGTTATPYAPKLQKASSSEGNSLLERLAYAVNDIAGKLPKNKTSLLKKAEIAANNALHSAVPATAPTISDMQAVIADAIIPTLDASITKLRQVQGKGFTFTATPAMSGGDTTDTTYLDDGEFYAIDAVLSALKHFLLIMTAYNFDVDYNLIEYDFLGIINGYQSGLTGSVTPFNTNYATWATKFFTLKSDGAAKMTAAHLALTDAVDMIEKGYFFIYTEDPNPLTDNGIEFSDMTADDHSLIQNMLNAFQGVLAGEVTASDTCNTNTGERTNSMTYGTTTIIQTSDEGCTSADETVRIDFSKFYTNPLDRTDLPTFQYDGTYDLSSSLADEETMCDYTGYTEDCGIVDIVKANFTDATLNGIFPDGIPE